MEGKFEVITTINKWEPPFDKSKKTIEYIGSEGEEFDDEVKGNVFKILQLHNDYALIQFNHQFTPKKSQFAVNDLIINDQIIKLPKNIDFELSFMWGNKGITKKLKYIGKEE